MRWIVSIVLAVMVLPILARGEELPSLIVVVGAPGEAAYGEVFQKAADRWLEAAKQAKLPASVIGRDPTSTSPTDKQRFKDLLDTEVKESTQPLWIVLIGHGTYDGREAKFNLRDSDFSDVELATWLRPCVRPLAFIDCSSSSATFLNKLSARNRVIITATRTGQEVNYSRFGDLLSAAITDPSADLDKDGQVSLLEAFLAASHRVDEFYKTEGRLATEHALLDDNGDALGTSADFFQGIRAVKAARSGAALDGARAHQWILIPSAAELALSPDDRARRNELELQIESLRARKLNLPEDEYYAKLDPLLLSLAKVYQAAETQPATAPSQAPAPAR